MNPFSNAGIYLIKMLFDLYIFVVMLRILLQLVHADHFNPLSRMVIKLTKYPLKPFYRVIPKIKQFDVAAVIYILILEMVKIILLLLVSGIFPHILGLFVWSVAELFSQLFNLYFYLLILLVIVSWLTAVHKHTPLASVLHQLTDPILAPIKKIIPVAAGLDFSPLIALVISQVLLIILINPLVQIGMRLAIG
jgi:YggT family protein